MRFKAWSGEVFEIGGELEPEVIEDSCWVTLKYYFTLFLLSFWTFNFHIMAETYFLSGLQMKDGRWHQTHFVFHSLDPTLLPVVDIYNLPETNPGSHYHLEIGPVCFL